MFIELTSDLLAVQTMLLIASRIVWGWHCPTVFRLIAHCATGPVNTASQTEWAVRQLYTLTNVCFFLILFIQHANHALTIACEQLVYHCLAATWRNSLILQLKNFQKITKTPLIKFLKTRRIQVLCLCLRKSWNVSNLKIINSTTTIKRKQQILTFLELGKKKCFAIVFKQCSWLINRLTNLMITLMSND